MGLSPNSVSRSNIYDNLIISGTQYYNNFSAILNTQITQIKGCTSSDGNKVEQNFFFIESKEMAAEETSQP